MNRLDRLHRRSIYVVGTVLFLTGIAWAFLHYLSHFAGIDEHPATSAGAALMKVHGAAAMLALLLLGTLLAHHVDRGWKQSRNKASGITIIAITALLTITGYLLYYLGTEAPRRIASVVHLALGAVLPLPVLVHAYRMMRLRARRRIAFINRISASHPASRPGSQHLKLRLPSPAAALPRIRSPRSRPPPGRIRPGESPGRESG